MKYEKYILSLVFLPLGCAFIMTSILIYPEMVKYQPSSKLGATIKKNGTENGVYFILWNSSL
jgi:uncharacterized membrane protein